MTTTIICGDAALELPKLASESVHLGVMSPPYDDLRTYGTGATPDFNLEVIGPELFRVLAPGGVLCWNVGDGVVDGSETLTSMEQALFFVRQVGFRMHDTMIFEKLNFSNPEKARYHQMWEYVFVLSKGAPRAFNPIKDKRNVTAGAGTLGENTSRQVDGSMLVRERKVSNEYGMRGNVWRGKTRGQEKVCARLHHPAMMPTWLAHDLIRSWSNPGDVVLDACAGSGTTGREAIRLGRDAVLIEKHAPYVDDMRADLLGITPYFAEVA